jgi:hypothetical protein
LILLYFRGLNLRENDGKERHGAAEQSAPATAIDLGQPDLADFKKQRSARKDPAQPKVIQS